MPAWRLRCADAAIGLRVDHLEVAGRLTAADASRTRWRARRIYSLINPHRAANGGVVGARAIARDEPRRITKLQRIALHVENGAAKPRGHRRCHAYRSRCAAAPVNAPGFAQLLQAVGPQACEGEQAAGREHAAKFSKQRGSHQSERCEDQIHVALANGSAQASLASRARRTAASRSAPRRCATCRGRSRRR